MFYPYLADNSKIVSFLNLVCVKNVPKKVTNRYILSLGFLSSNDRLLINLAKFLGLIDAKGIPTDLYNEIYTSKKYSFVLAKCITSAYKSIYLKDKSAHHLTEDILLNLFQQESTQSNLVQAVKTFKYLGSIADFTQEGSLNVSKKTSLNVERQQKTVNLNLTVNIGVQEDYDKLLHLLNNILSN